MDTVRSEYSEGSLASSRFDDEGATARASISFSVSSANSHSSRLSIDGATTRSYYFSSFERKFRERNAVKHKKMEKAKREKEKADRQQLFSADIRRKAEREADRQARRKEMENWLTDPKELRRIERKSQKRSRDRMQALKQWYVPATSGPQEEVQPVFVAAMEQEQGNQEYTRRKRVVKPVLTKEAAAIKDEEDREAFEVVLQKQLSAFTSKLEYLEQFADPSTAVQVRAKTRAVPRRRRRIAREDMLLAPLSPAHSKMKTAKSIATLQMHYSSKDDRKLAASMSLQTLRSIPRTLVDGGDAEDDAEVEEYLSRHRKVAKQTDAAVKLQATWRMYQRRRKYLPWRQRRTRHRRAIFEIWVMTYKVGYRAQRSLLKKYLNMWHIEVVEALQLREMELHLFRQAATQTELPRMVLNLVFTSDWEDERAKRLAAKAAEAAKKKDIAPSNKVAFLSAFVSSAFGDVESATDKGRSRVHQLRAQHVAAREEVRKKIVQHVFRLWKRVHEADKRVGLNAQLCLKRAVRMAFGARQRWPAEILLSVFEIWARWASFSRCKRLGLPLPHFAQSNPHWDIWLHNYQERQVRCVKAAAKAPGARLRRYFLRLHAFARRQIRKRYAVVIATAHYDRTLRRKVLIEWRNAIADSAAEKKLIRGVLLRMHRYAFAKRKLRPLKETLRQRQRKWFSSRVWRAWKRVQLHVSFKRELNQSQLENSQMCRFQLHRTLDIWRDERDSLLFWRTFVAWAHFVRKRKLFLTLKLLCARQQRRNLLFGVFTAWKAAKWDRVDCFLEDSLRLDAWDAYRELSAFFPMMFYGSFSDAGSIFGGLPNYMYGEGAAFESLKQDKQEVQLSTLGDAVRHFHGILVCESVVEVRNAILQSRHLVNAVDDASGNTALHVAAQIEEPERRLEILSLLLSEGAATLRRLNRHGLSPEKLAHDTDTRLLLDEGVFAYYSRNAFHHEAEEEDFEDHCRLLWCMVALMTREWGVGTRIPADVRSGQWHSSLRDELWLRQKKIRFAVDSTFAPSATRSRGFLNALKTRLCISHHDVLHGTEPYKKLRTTEDLSEARQLRYQEWEERSKVRRAEANEAGEYAAYARYILATTLDTEACEQELIPSFVGLLFSLGFTLDDVLQQAFKLEEECVAAESELWKLFQRIQQAENAWSMKFAQHSNSNTATTERTDVGMLRLFSDDADADLFFRREIFLLEFEHFNASDRDLSKDGMDIHQEALALEIDSLMIRTRRKLRKADKKVKRVQDQIDVSERAYREALFATSRRVEDICATRMTVEQARLLMAMALLKQEKVKTIVSRLAYAKHILTGDGRASAPPPVENLQLTPPSIAAQTFAERKSLLEKEMARYTRMFQTKFILEEARTKEKEKADPSQEPTLYELPEALHPLQKAAARKLHTLFVKYLLRICCCWLAENMIAMDESNEENENEESDDEEALDIDETGSTEQQTTTRALSVVGTLFIEGIPRRRSSIQNSRRVLETYGRGFSSLDLLDPDNETMNATYTASAALLFEEERRVAQEAELARLSTKKVETITAITERNPVTGELELPPDHTVNIDMIRDPTPTKLVGKQIKEIPRNRKKEELQRAMRHRKLERERRDSSDNDSDDNMDASQGNLLPMVYGTEIHFGNFVSGNRALSFGEPSRAQSPSDNAASLTVSLTNTDAMWKRGGIRQTDGNAPSIKEVLQTHRLSSSKEKQRAGRNRPQGVATLAAQPPPPEVPQPLETAQDSQPLSSIQRKDSQGPLRVEASNSGTKHETPKQRSSVLAKRVSLERATSTPSLLPDTTSIAIPTEIAAKPEPGQVADESRPSSRDKSTQETQLEQEPSGDVAIPAVQINSRSEQNSASSTRTGRISRRKEVDADTSRSQLDHLEQKSCLDTNQNAEFEIDPVATDEAQIDVSYEDQEPAEAQEHNVGADAERVNVIETMIQSPSVAITTSRTAESPAETTRSNRPVSSQQTYRGGESRRGSLARSASASIKWEAGTTLDAFPLMVTPNNQQRSLLIGSRELEEGPRVRSLRVVQTHTQPDELVASCFVLDESADYDPLLENSVDDSREMLTLQGKPLTMAKKQKRKLGKNTTTGAIRAAKQAPIPAQQEQNPSATNTSERNSPDNSPSVRPISVSVSTKPTQCEFEDAEDIEIMPELPTITKAPMSLPKPFVKLDDTSETENDLGTAAALQLEGLGLNSSMPSLSLHGGVETFTLDGQKKNVEPGMSPVKPVEAARSSRLQIRRVRQESGGDFTLQGARMTRNIKSVGKLVEVSGFEDMAPMSKTEKERLWREFASEPFSTSVQDAYTILYSQTYSVSERQSHQMQSGLSFRTPSSLSQPALRVDATRQPIHKAIELDRKFWSAVEGYRAIGTSSLVPLDAATIFQRRQDKAQAIVDQFFRGHRVKGGDGSRGLALAWLDMYPNEVTEVLRQLPIAPKGLFDELQRTAELQISAALARRQTEESPTVT